jgi:hypothetical protein
VILQGCFDDSGDMTTGPVFVLAGMIAPVDKWLAFSNEWAQALIETPYIEYFKCAEAQGLRGQFSIRNGWNRDLSV